MNLNDSYITALVAFIVAVALVVGFIFAVFNISHNSDKDRKLSFVQMCIKDGDVLTLNGVEIVCKFAEDKK